MRFELWIMCNGLWSFSCGCQEAEWWWWARARKLGAAAHKHCRTTNEITGKHSYHYAFIYDWTYNPSGLVSVQWRSFVSVCTVLQILRSLRRRGNSAITAPLQLDLRVGPKNLNYVFIKINNKIATRALDINVHRKYQTLWTVRVVLLSGPWNEGNIPPMFCISRPLPCWSGASVVALLPLRSPKRWSPSSYLRLKCRYVGDRGRKSTTIQFFMKLPWVKGLCRSCFLNLWDCRYSLVVSPRPIKKRW